MDNQEVDQKILDEYYLENLRGLQLLVNKYGVTVQEIRQKVSEEIAMLNQKYKFKSNKKHDNAN